MVNGRQPNSLFAATSPITADGMEGDAVTSSRAVAAEAWGGRSGLDAHVIDATTTRRQPTAQTIPRPSRRICVGGGRGAKEIGPAL